MCDLNDSKSIQLVEEGEHYSKGQEGTRIASESSNSRKCEAGQSKQLLPYKAHSKVNLF